MLGASLFSFNPLEVSLVGDGNVSWELASKLIKYRPEKDPTQTTKQRKHYNEPLKKSSTPLTKDCKKIEASSDQCEG